jgi:methionine aminopeptidase
VRGRSPSGRRHARGAGARRCDAARRSWRAIAAARVGLRGWGTSRRRFEDVGIAGGYGIVRPFVGPWHRHGHATRTRRSPNYRTGLRGVELQPGICLAIEPMFTLGDGEVYVESRQLDVATQDDALRPTSSTPSRSRRMDRDPDPGLTRRR